ncbi:MAG: L,D-transpeptidase family protein [Rubripirellula sp.]
MQTLKTAAIVVLMMAVMYGAYVSLTTPPEPLPADVQDRLVINEEGTLAIDAGLPESLGALDISSGTSTTLPSSAAPGYNDDAMNLADLALPGEALPPSAVATDSLTVSAGDGGISRSLTDTPAVGTPSAGTSISPQMPSEPATQSAVAGASLAGAGQSYPSTGNTFDLPDPSSVGTTFDSSGVNLPNPDLALASGTSPATPPGGNEAVSPIAALDTTAPSGATSASTSSPNVGLANAIRAADKQYAEDKRQDALSTLSLFYNTPNISGEQRSELLSRLDPLARDVIYSKRHLLEQPHRVGQSETLVEIAARYEVPWQLLANINEIDDPVTVLPGTELKVVRGPFRAEVNLTLNELTLFLGDLYAGRFPIGVGSDPVPKPGTFTIQDKQTSKTFYNAAGSPVSPDSPENPYGEVWLDLGSQLSIHGSPNTSSPTTKGCISLAADYADDLYGILSQGSSVTIRR